MNISEILRNAPKGLKLYSPLCGEVKFIKVEDMEVSYPIRLKCSCDRDLSFTYDGRFYVEQTSGECLLFPSKENKTWVGWQAELFKVGDVITSDNCEDSKWLILDADRERYEIIYSNGTRAKIFYKSYHCYATPEEREEFFKKLEANGYKWDEKLSTLEQIGKNCKEYKPRVTDYEDFREYEKEDKPSEPEHVGMGGLGKVWDEQAIINRLDRIIELLERPNCIPYTPQPDLIIRPYYGIKPDSPYGGWETYAAEKSKEK